MSIQLYKLRQRFTEVNAHPYSFTYQLNHHSKLNGDDPWGSQQVVHHQDNWYSQRGDQIFVL